jgi:hypothetical protein
MPEKAKRGSNGGTARANKLTKEERSAIAKQAAQRRWSKKSENQEPDPGIPSVRPIDVPASVPEPFGESEAEISPKHCPACLNGESLEEGEGTHILATVEHPVTLPAGFEEAEATVVVPVAPTLPQKPTKHKAKPMPKELRTASSYAEKRLPQAIKEKADLLVEVARREAEIQELTRVIQALGGQSPVGIPNGSYQNPAYNPNTAPYTPPTAPQLPPMYPEYQNPQATVPVVTQVKPMQAGGAGVAQGMLSVPTHWYEG